MERHPATGRFLLHPELKLTKLTMLPSTTGGVVILCPNCWCGYLRPTSTRGNSFCKVHRSVCLPPRKTADAEDDPDFEPCAYPDCPNPKCSRKGIYCGSHQRQLRLGQELRPLRKYSKNPPRPPLDLERAIALRAAGYSWEELAEELGDDPKRISQTVRGALRRRSKGGSSK